MSTTFSPPLSGLPDPYAQAEFYADVPVKRLIAWGLDATLIFLVALLISLLTVGLGFFIFGFLILAISFIYRSVSLANRSATLGMRMVAIARCAIIAASASILPPPRCTRWATRYRCRW